MSYSVYCVADLGAHNTGLTVHGKLYDAAGTLVTTITTGVVEVVDGLYQYVLNAPDTHAGAFVLYNSADATLRRSFMVAPRETENADVLTSSADIPTAAQIDTQLSGTHGAGAWATATGFATPANVTAAQTAITAAQPSAAAVVAAIMAYAVATGKTFEQAMLNIWSVTVGDSVADDAEYPTSIVYDNPTGATNVTHTLTDTTRVAS